MATEKGKSWQDNRDRTVVTGQSGHDGRDKTVETDHPWTRYLKQDSQTKVNIDRI
jgi:hypothetical protein